MGHMNVLAAKAAHHYAHEPTRSFEALRAGVVDSEGLFKCLCLALYEGALILAHYGRLGPVFDQCAKSIVDVLREEGMYRDKGADVVEVVTRAMEEVSLYNIGLESG